MKKWRRMCLSIAIVEMLLLVIVFARTSLIRESSWIFYGEDLERSTNHNSVDFSVTTSVPKGVYEICVSYDQNGINDGDSYSFVSSLEDGRMLSDMVPLFDYKSVISYRMYAKSSSNLIRITCGSSKPNFQTNVNTISVTYKKSMTLFCAVMKWAALFIIFDISMEMMIGIIHADPKARRKRLALCAEFVFAVLPILIIGTGKGDDLRDHLVRLASIADELSRGHFPIRMSSMLYNGYGYPFNIFYPYLLYLIPAVLYLHGLPLYIAYDAYMILITLITVGISYYSFTEMSASDEIGIWASLIYSLSVWRFTDCFNRAAVGEYTAIALLPLLFLAFYRFTRKENDLHKASLEFIIAYTMLFQSHMLTTVVSTMALVLLACIFFKEVFTKRKILYIAGISGITVLLNLWYLVPLMDYYLRYDMVLQTEQNAMWKSGTALKKMLSLRMITFNESGKVKFEVVKNPGFALFIIMTIFVACMVKKYILKERKWAFAAFFMTVLNLWMITYYFPYKFLHDHFRTVFKLISSVQFSMRYNLYVLIFAVILGVFLLKNLRNHRIWYYVAITATAVATVISWYSLSEQFYAETRMNVKDAEIFGTYPYDDLYLMADTDGEKTKDHTLLTSGNVTAYKIDDRGGYHYSVENSSDKEGFLDADILMYNGYHAYSGREELNLSFGENNRARIKIPGNFRGVVAVQFDEPWYWKINEIISFVTLLVMVLIAARYEIFKNRNLQETRRITKAK